ncbi:hypothetical protein A3I36_00595 [Candidatus Giovannonibacteria bacterium RIFCSPLOWO2_02_FULL_45_28]|uniref:Methyltransferase type 11 n=3 Tax=Parcubacteria group TaxID=1794811 RepID=A0A837IJC5_9BACT|nr:MAG: Methyltransferase type 11 [Parcubacteria group bacterium GW2011_GWC1_44_10]KKT60420.1 MAG: Methyltransferase type 11 [Candidatus Giovannonibacteria bacterium GW2011_GWA1_44_25]KKU12196.1 MAG: Methyltransferase type 11 [Candidatus Azambacteria bacterium GW2011_GWC2_45_7b]KKU30278.1 MAG: Methyltransferase type 11 [Candidatus Giovannonibacteria bacterium GW2011_GWB1_46_20]OGF50485.1 MAG: hypothetical protein A2120_02465 [Candidatus Giovannonibacteria bacterium GWA2_45_15]OGF59618.1 MAG: h
MRNFMESLFCPGCKGDLENRPSFVVCKKCGITHEIKNGAIFFIKDRENSFRNLGNKDSLIFKVKGCLKKHPKLFLFLLALRAPIIGKTAKEFIRDLHSDALVLNVGSGVQFIGQNVINVDYYPFPGVSVVADAYNLPFKDGSVDAVIAESLLEHVVWPEKIIAGFRRVLKPGGLVYIVTPFIFGFHSSPDDYYRWTTSGLRELLSGFKEKEAGVLVGPTSAVTAILGEWLATLFSFNIKSLYQFWALFFMAVSIPINLLDWVLGRLKLASSIASAIYFIGEKIDVHDKTV